MLLGLRWEGKRQLLYECEQAAGRAGTFSSDSSVACISLPADFGSVLATVSGNGSGPAIRSLHADSWPRLAARVAGAAWSLEYLIRGITLCEAIRC